MSLDLNYIPSAVQNFLVPANGQTHVVKQILTAVPGGTSTNWLTFKSDVGWKFTPQGAYIDNRAGVAALSFTSSQTGFNFSVAAGQYQAMPFPAAPDDIWTITGNGNVVIYWVDYPVFPWNYLGGIAQHVIIDGQPISVTVPATAGGAPYQVQTTPQTGAYQHLTATAAGATSAAAPAANINLRKLRVTLTGNAAMAAAGLQVITISLNGVTVLTENVYLPNAAPAAPSGEVWTSSNINFDTIAFSTGAGPGNLTINLGTALTSGLCEVNAWYD